MFSRKQTTMLRNIFDLYDKMKELHDAGVELKEITDLDIFDRIARMKYEESEDELDNLNSEINKISSTDFEIIAV